MKFNFGKKGQLEILGMAIVMVILLFAFIIYLRFTSEPPAPVENFFFSQLPSQTLSTILGTTTDCRDLKVGVLIADVASHTDSSGGIDTGQLISCGGGRTSETEVFDPANSVIVDIFARTFDDAAISYEFSVALRSSVTSVPVRLYDTSSPVDCSNARRVDAETFLIQSDNGPVEVTLRVC